MRVRAAVLGAFALALVIVIAALIAGRMPGPGSDAARDVAASQSGSSRSPGASDHGLEQNPSPRAQTPYRLPSVEPPAPLVTTPFPKAATARGAIVQGFPTAVIPLAPRSSVTYSSVSPDRTRLGAGLDATSTLPPDEVLGYYRTALAPLGLVATTAPAVGGSMAVAFVRGPSTVTVTASAAAGGSRYSIHGVLVAGS
jgi:hypothetical protein